jgi:hypothetical protein
VEQETDKASPNRKTHHELVTTLPEIVPVDETRDVTFEDRGCGEAASSCITATKRKGRTKVTRWVGAEETDRRGCSSQENMSSNRKSCNGGGVRIEKRVDRNRETAIDINTKASC